MRRKATEEEVRAYLKLLDALRGGKDNQIKVTSNNKNDKNDTKARN